MEKILNHFSDFIFKYFYILPIFIFNLISCSIDSHSIIEGYCLKAVLLPSEKYFIILDKGIYIYNNDFSVNKILYNFTSDEKVSDSKYIQIEEMKINNNNFITVLSKGKYLYIFEAENNKFYNLFLQIGVYSSYFIPYKYYNSTLEYIIYYINEYQINFFLYKFKLLFPYTNELINSLSPLKDIRSYNSSKSINNFIDFALWVKDKITGNDDSNNDYNSIDSSYISCQKKILQENYYLICFYMIKDCTDKDTCFKKIKANTFDIDNNLVNIKVAYYNFNEGYVYKIKSTFTNDENKILVCIELSSKFYCLIYNITNNEFYQFEKNNEYCYYFDLYCFQNSNKNIIFCYNSNEYNLYVYNNDFIFEDIYRNNEMKNYCQNYYITFSLIYFFEKNMYLLIDDCQRKENPQITNLLTTILDFSDVTFPSSTNLFNNRYSLDSSISTGDIKSYIEESDLPLDSSKNSMGFNSYSFSTIIPSSFIYSDFLTIPSSLIYSESLPIPSSLIHSKSLSNKNNIVNSKEDEIIKNKTDLKKDEIIENFQNIINEIEIGKNYEISGEDFTISIKPTNSSYLENETHVNFIQCENTLRKELNISSSRIITFLQMEIENKNEKSLINQIEYMAYDDNRKPLNLSLCNDSSIQIVYALKNNSLDMNEIISFKDLGIDIFNINDSFFNDICQPYSDSNNDIVLKDRIKEIYQNYSLCDDGCKYSQFNDTYMTISCDCKVKNNISINETSLNLEQFDNIDIESNFGIIKCYNLVFSLDGKSKNIGFWIFLFLIGIHIPFLLHYFCKGIKSIKEYILNEMRKNGYIKDKNINKTKSKIKTLSNPPLKNNIKKSKKVKKERKIIDNSSIRKIQSSKGEVINSLNKNKKK